MESKNGHIRWVRLASEKGGNIQKTEGDWESVLKGDGNKRRKKKERERGNMGKERRIQKGQERKKRR